MTHSRALWVVFRLDALPRLRPATVWHQLQTNSKHHGRGQARTHLAEVVDEARDAEGPLVGQALLNDRLVERGTPAQLHAQLLQGPHGVAWDAVLLHSGHARRGGGGCWSGGGGHTPVAADGEVAPGKENPVCGFYVPNQQRPSAKPRRKTED